MYDDFDDNLTLLQEFVQWLIEYDISDVFDVDSEVINNFLLNREKGEI